MLPTPDAFLTVKMPSATTHWAGVWSWAETHSSSFLPSNKMIASEGGAPKVAPGVTTFGTGVQISVSSGFGLDGCCEDRAAVMEARVANARRCENRMLIVGDEDTPAEASLPAG